LQCLIKWAQKGRSSFDKSYCDVWKEVSV
jgi:hypothetical protein